MEAESGVAGGRARGTRFEGQQCGPGGFSASWRAFSLLLSPEFRCDAAQQCCPAHAAGEPLARGRGPGLPHRVQGGRTSSAWAVTGRTALIRSVTKDIVWCVCVCVWTDGWWSCTQAPPPPAHRLSSKPSASHIETSLSLAESACAAECVLASVPNGCACSGNAAPPRRPATALLSTPHKGLFRASHWPARPAACNRAAQAHRRVDSVDRRVDRPPRSFPRSAAGHAVPAFALVGGLPQLSQPPARSARFRDVISRPGGSGPPGAGGRGAGRPRGIGPTRPAADWAGDGYRTRRRPRVVWQPRQNTQRPALLAGAAPPATGGRRLHSGEWVTEVIFACGRGLFISDRRSSQVVQAGCCAGGVVARWSLWPLATCSKTQDVVGCGAVLVCCGAVVCCALVRHCVGGCVFCRCFCLVSGCGGAKVARLADPCAVQQPPEPLPPNSEATATATGRTPLPPSNRIPSRRRPVPHSRTPRSVTYSHTHLYIEVALASATLKSP